jgi:hypothetical protein
MSSSRTRAPRAPSPRRMHSTSRRPRGEDARRDDSGALRARGAARLGANRPPQAPRGHRRRLEEGPPCIRRGHGARLPRVRPRRGSTNRRRRRDPVVVDRRLGRARLDRAGDAVARALRTGPDRRSLARHRSRGRRHLRGLAGRSPRRRGRDLDLASLQFPPISGPGCAPVVSRTSLGRRGMTTSMRSVRAAVASSRQRSSRRAHIVGATVDGAARVWQ